MKPVVGFPSRRALLLASATLLIALAASVAYTAYDLTKPSEVIGIAAEKHIGHGTDHRATQSLPTPYRLHWSHPTARTIWISVGP